MTKQKEKLIEKLVKKDYNNDLEEILAKKTFNEEVKNLLLDIFYKIEMSYKDYENVKKNVFSRDEYIENIIDIIKNDCESICFIRPDNTLKKTFEVNKEKKQIICYPITRKLLYCLAKIQKSDDIIKQDIFILNKSLTDMINIGSNINMVEPLRDFNGYSWNISVLDIENFYYNLIYQDLIILVGNRLLDEWTCKHDNMIDYMDLFREKLQTKYGKKLSKEILQLLENIAILLELFVNKSFKNEMLLRKQEIEKEIKTMENKEKYLEDLSKQKKQLTKKIKDIDIILNDKNKLAIEYENRNKNLPLQKKIFSKRVLKNNLEEERYELIDELQRCNKKMNSKKFLQLQKSLKAEQKYMQLIENEDYEKKALELIIMLQKRVLQSLHLKIKQAKNRDELIKIFYEIRYFNLIPFDVTKKMSQIPRLKKMINTIKSEVIEKAYELKIITEISKNKELNFTILENIFSLNIIKLEDIHLKIIKEKDNKAYIQFYDDNVTDEKIDINLELKKEDLKIKFNKKVILFI